MIFAKRNAFLFRSRLAGGTRQNSAVPRPFAKGNGVLFRNCRYQSEELFAHWLCDNSWLHTFINIPCANAALRHSFFRTSRIHYESFILNSSRLIISKDFSFGNIDFQNLLPIGNFCGKKILLSYFPTFPLQKFDIESSLNMVNLAFPSRGRWRA